METEIKQVLLTCPATTITPIIKVVGENCNIKCDYCYYNEKNQHHSIKQIMTHDILDLFISEYLNLFGGEVDFIWHGGEPLLAGITFYRDILEIQQLYSKEHKICNAIQTNGTLINEQWVEFFKTNNFQVSISLDGIEKCHNRFRRDNAGNGTFAKVIDAVWLLRKSGIEPKILQTVTKSSIAYISENFKFFVEDLKLKNWGINIFMDVEMTNPLMKDQSLSNDDYFILYKTLFDLWLERNDPKLIIREIDDFVFGVLGKKTTTCSTSGCCTSFMTVNWDGFIIPTCDNLVPKNLHIGENIKNTHLVDILNNQKRLDFAQKINTLPSDCKECEWIPTCFNGYSYHRTKGDIMKNSYCIGQKRIFSYISEQLHEMKAIA
ncbi:MAG: radical SAM protein [Bacteroidales bacterium]|nr:radical SAM protein [Bacteroidales bacterium]